MSESTKLKEYLKNVFDLEGALYQHQQLVDGYIAHRQNDAPSEPVKELPSPPIKPIPRVIPDIQNIEKPPRWWFLVVLGFFTTLIGPVFLVCFIVLAAGGLASESMAVAWLSIGIILTMFAIFSWQETKEIEKSLQAEIEEANQADFDKYEKAMEAHQIGVEKAETEYSNKMQLYTQKITEYERETNEQLKRFDEVKAILQTSLTKLYSQNIVYAKYRNLVSIATIYEYFDSGRCTELEGPNGAYNMYEGELRSNVIICSLSQIISDLGQIKNAQYALYEQISRANENVAHILSNIYNAQVLTAYCAEAAAIAASADRITCGVVF